MAIEKLSEFAKDGQKNTDDLVLTDGFSVSRKPARQWFNYLFNMLSLKINEIIELDPVARSEIADNLTTDDANKVASARTVKELQDNKLDKNANAVSAAKLQTARNINGVSFNGTANISIPGVGTRSPVNMTATRLLNTVYTNTDIIPRVVSIFGGRSAGARNTIIVDGEIFSEIQAANNYYDSSTMLAIVPPGKAYQVTGSPILRWVEQ